MSGGSHTAEPARAGRHWGKDVVIALALLGAGFVLAWIRFRPFLGTEGRYTDGRLTYDRGLDESVRFAVWDRPELLGPDVATASHEGRGTVSPDGRWLVFAVGERGAAADLWRAEVVDGQPLDPEPLDALNTAADELAPAFGPGGLYFASDRSGTRGGLDLWRAPWRDGRCDPPEWLGPAINSVADDTDPAPGARGGGLAFASARGGGPREDFDLYLARGGQVERLEALCTGSDERDPAFAADGRALFFASDRAGGRGGFDLYRSGLGPEGWSPPRALEGLNGPLDERGPMPQSDGFALLFSGESLDTAGDLWRARSLELFRDSGPPVGWRELLVLAALLTLALLAWGAKRWSGLDVVYRCFLVSVGVHLALLWLLREVYPEPNELGTVPDGQRLRVRISAPVAADEGARVERGGALELARAQEPARPARTEAVEPRVPVEASRPAVTALQRLPERPTEAPRRAAVEVERRSTQRDAPVALQVPGSEAPPYAAAAEPLSAPSVAAVAPRIARPLAPVGRRASSATEAESRLPPSTVPADPSLGLPARAADAAPRASALVRGADDRTPTAPTLALRTPERGAPLTALAAPEVELAAASSAHERARTSSGPGRRSVERPAAEALSAGGSSFAGPLLERLEIVVDGRAPAPPARAGFDVEGLESSHEIAVRAPVGATATKGVSPTSERAPDLTLDGLWSSAALARADAARADAAREGSAERPSRRGGAGALEVSRPTAEASLAPLGRAGAMAPPARRRSADGPAARSAAVAVLAPGSGVSGAPSSPAASALPAPEPPLTPSALTRGLARTLLSGPERRRGAPEAADGAGPAALVLELAERGIGRPSDPTPARLAGVWDRTPYRAREGAAKLAALERFGGSEETEAAVRSGLAYLARVQRPAGHWGDAGDYDEKYHHVSIGKTGLSLLAFLAAGHTPAGATEHAPTVRAAVDFLLAVQDADTGHFGNCSAYGHLIATYALAEAFALTGAPSLRAPLERAVARVLETQETRNDPRFLGGWSYFYPDGSDYDRWPRASITAWAVMALESARLGGIDVPERAFERARAFLGNAWDDRRGAYRYSHDPARLRSQFQVLPGSTPAALFGLSLLGENLNEPEYAAARRYVADRAPRRYGRAPIDRFVSRADGNLYFWYYGSLAMFRTGGDDWQRWNVALKEALLPAQAADGSWEPISTYAEYAGDDAGDKSYTTALCVLSLEVYYRYFTPTLESERAGGGATPTR